MSNELKLSLNFDYNNLVYRISASYLDGMIIPAAGVIPAQIIDDAGVVVATTSITPTSEYGGLKAGHAAVPFGQVSVYNYAYPRGSNSGSLFFTNPYSEFRPEYYLDPGYVAYSGLVASSFSLPAPIMPKGTDKFIGVPVQLGRGEASLNAKITSVVSGHKIVWSNPTLSVSAQPIDFSLAEVTVLSGSNQGSKYRVVSYDNSINTFHVDRSGLVANQIIQVAPRATISGYSGWSDFPYRCKLDLDKALPVGVGNHSGTITFSGSSYWNILGVLPVEATTCFISSDIYYRTPAFGDIIQFKDAGGANLSGMVVGYNEVNSTTWGVQFIPRNTPGPTAPNNNFTLVRSAEYDIEYYPQFGKYYTVQSVQSGANPWFVSESFKAPDVSMELSAGDYDSAFAGVLETSHFHIGPVHLSDGSVLTGSKLILSGTIYNNNPVSSPVLASWTRFLSNNISVASYYRGTYTKFNQLIGTYSQAFTTPDIITLTAGARLGSAYINKTINFPVQPPV